MEGSGNVDVIDVSNGITLKRFQNTGAFLGQASFSLGVYIGANALTWAAIDKTNDRVYLAYQNFYQPICLQCLGCLCPTGGTKGYINQYDFQGNLLGKITLPGISATAGSCYTPSMLAVDPQGSIYVADTGCQQLLKYSPAGALLNDVKTLSWSPYFYQPPRGMWTDPASNLYISQQVCNSSGYCPLGVAKLSSSASLITTVLADSAVGCALDDRILYLTSSGGEPIQRFIFDNAPSVPTETSPLGSLYQHSPAVSMSWQASNDPDGDPISYSVYAGTNPNQLVFIGSTTNTSLTNSNFSFGTTYYWRVTAQDFYLGLPVSVSSAPIASLVLNFLNRPPDPFGVLSGTGTIKTRRTSANPAWQIATDPDGDPVIYDLVWGTAPAAMLPVVTTTATAWQISGLTFNTTYYWAVSAHDPYGATTPMSGGIPQTYYQVFQNSPPSAPAIVSGSGTFGEHTSTPSATLAWAAGLDPDGDPVAYRIYFGTAPANLLLIQDSTATTGNVPGLQFGTSLDSHGGALS